MPSITDTWQGRAWDPDSALHLSVAGELEQLQGGLLGSEGGQAWGEEQAGTLVARAPPGEGEVLLRRESEGGERGGETVSQASKS